MKNLLQRLLGVALCSVSLLPLPVAAVTLAEALERAWQRSVEGQSRPAQEALLEARQSAASAWSPAPPTLGLAQRSDRFNEKRGVLEHEVEIAMPLWLPGQQAARETLVAAEQQQLTAAEQVTRLALAGELRSLYWQWRQLREEETLLKERLALADTLMADVTRRVAAGDLARTDLLLETQEQLAASAAVAEIGIKITRLHAQLQLLTGLTQWPADTVEADADAAAAVTMRPGEVDWSGHPRLRAADAALQRAQAAWGDARATSREAPNVKVQWLQERAQFGAAAERSVRFGVSLPLSGTRYRQPLLAAANVERVAAEAGRQRLLDELTLALQTAQAELRVAKTSLQLASQREQAADERLRLLTRAFELGDLPLVEYWRTRLQAFAARAEQRRSRVAVAAALAQLNQAQGRLP